MRRLYLEGRLDEFIDMRRFIHFAMPKEKQNWGATFWRVARQYFDFESVESEKRKCHELEESLLVPHMWRASLLNQQTERMQAMAEKSTEASYAEEIRWAFQNWPRFLKRKEGGGYKLVNAEELDKEAPSLGAVGLIQYAEQNLNQFQQLCAKVMAKVVEGTEEEKEDKHDRKSLDELDQLLDGLDDGA